jgi:DNA helicase-2/ATP-dependent DNA helicase PcrA
MAERPPARLPDPGSTHGDLVTRLRVREPLPLDQLPVWEGFQADPPATDGDVVGLDALLGGLNAEQLRAVTHDAGPLLVVAGAGTGKTQVITRRIAWLVATRRARPAEILGLTFTDKAADEMQVRVDQLVPYGYADTGISTFHAFGDRLIREFAFELGLPGSPRVLGRAESVIFLREHLFELELDRYRPLGDPTRFLAALVGFFSRCKDEDISPEALARHAQDLQVRAEALAAAPGVDMEALVAAREEAARQQELAGAFARYQALLAENGFIDFGDQVALALRLLRSSTSVRREVASRFRYILVDEFQDTNPAQSELVALLADGHRNLMVVGDDDQSIYRFRGAAVSNILQFRDRYPGCRTVVLRRNYRSLGPILDASRRLIRFNDPDRLEVRAGISKRLQPERKSAAPAPVRLESFATIGQEADWLAADIRRRVAAGSRPRDHAILVRANADADPILRSLSAAGIPWRFSGTSGLYARPEVRLLLSFLRLVADPGSSVDLYALAASSIYDLGGEDLAALSAAARRRRWPLRDLLIDVRAQPSLVRVSTAGRAIVERLLDDLAAYEEQARVRPAGEVLLAFLRGSGMLARLVAAGPAGEEPLANIARFFEIVRAQSPLLADDRAAFLAPHLGTLVEAGDDPATADLDPDADAVAVLTVHKAKGLEFPVVFLPGLAEGRFPLGARRDPLPLPLELVRETLPEGDFHLQEERRLFYVAMTRARDELVVSFAQDGVSGRARRVSPFVLEALDRPRAADVAPPGGRTTPLDRLPLATPEPEVGEAVTNGRTRGAERPLLLSYSAIDAYLTCPERYRLGHVIGVPVAPHHAMTYGAALHKAVQEFHRRQARSDVMPEAELLETFERSWSNEGFLSAAHEAARLEAGRDALRRFRVAQLQPDAVVPAYVERDFDFSLDGDRIRGRWDRVDVVPTGDAEPFAGGRRPSGKPDEAPYAPRADVVHPTLQLLGREQVTITDYKSGDIRDVTQARQRARDSLQLQIYAMAWEALTGRLPDAVQLHFLDSGVTGRTEVDPRRVDRARGRIAVAAAGIRRGAFEPTPGPTACGWCPFRQICSASVVP